MILRLIVTQTQTKVVESKIGGCDLGLRLMFNRLLDTAAEAADP